MKIDEIRRNNARLLAKSFNNDAEFAAKIERSATQVSRLIGKNPTKNIGTRIARDIEKAFGKHEGWMDTPHGEGYETKENNGLKLTPVSNSTPNNVSEPIAVKGIVPVISWVRAGSWEEAINYNDGYADDYVPCPAPHSSNTYALVVEGDSMTAPVGRSYPEGSIIFVDPEQAGSANTGDRIIAKLNGQNAVTFKQLAYDGSRPYLKALNPNHPPVFDEFKIIGKVIGMWIEG